MHKLGLALFLSAATGTACAQSNVAIYGRLNTGVEPLRGSK